MNQGEIFFVTNLSIKGNAISYQAFLLQNIKSVSRSFGLLRVTGSREVIRKNGIVDQTAQFIRHGKTEN
jgi:hypothetical protein